MAGIINTGLCLCYGPAAMKPGPSPMGHFLRMGVITHKNIWHWGQKITIVIASGRALCCVSVENDDLSVAYLHDLIVHTSIRRRGYGRRLLTLAERRARLMNCKKLVLWADPNEWMIEWYKRNGFVESGLRSDGLVNLEKNLE